jgi:hypothetical protein
LFNSYLKVRGRLIKERRISMNIIQCKIENGKEITTIERLIRPLFYVVEGQEGNPVFWSKYNKEDIFQKTNIPGGFVLGLLREKGDGIFWKVAEKQHNLGKGILVRLKSRIRYHGTIPLDEAIRGALKETSIYVEEIYGKPLKGVGFLAEVPKEFEIPSEIMEGLFEKRGGYFLGSNTMISGDRMTYILSPLITEIIRSGGCPNNIQIMFWVE